MAKNLQMENKTGHRSATPVIDVTAEPVGEVTLRDISVILRRHIRLFLGVITVVLVGLAVFLVVVTPKYEAKGQILIYDAAAGRVRNINSVIATPDRDVSDVPNSVKVLTSRVLAGIVVQSLALEGDPEFNKKLSRKNASARETDKPQMNEADAAAKADGAAKTDSAAKTDAIAKVATTDKTVATAGTDPQASAEVAATGSVLAAGGPAESAKPATIPLMYSPAHIVDSFLKQLEVSAERSSRVVDVAFESDDSKKAAKIVNELMETYLSNQVRYQKQALGKATGRLQKIVEDLRLEAVEAENAVQAYREKTQLVEGRGGEHSAGQRLVALNTQLIQALAEEGAVTARLNQMLALVKSPGSMRSAPEILANPLILRLRQTETELLRQRSDLSGRYGEKHPKLIKVRAELRDLRQKIQDEMNKIVEGLSNEAAVARAKLAALKARLGELKSEAIVVNNIQIRLRELELEVATKRAQHQTFMIRLRETSAQQEMIASTARIVSYAEVPTQPSFPNKTKTLGLGAMFAGVIAIVFVFVSEALRRTFETSSEIEMILGIRLLGVFPKIAQSRKIPGPSSLLHSNISNFQLGQSVRNVRSAMFLANKSRHPRSVLVTSAMYGEGKTTFVLSYASFCAANGQRVIVLDCDFGRPMLHKILGGSNSEGISDALLDEESLKSVIRTAPEMGFDFITNGQHSMNRPELLEESSVKRVLDALSWDYDVIIIDSSPVLAMTNAHILAKLADSTVLLIQRRKTLRDQAKAAVRCLYGSGAEIAGFVLTNVAPLGVEGPDSLLHRRGDGLVDSATPDNLGFLQRHFRRSKSA